MLTALLCPPARLAAAALGDGTVNVYNGCFPGFKDVEGALLCPPACNCSYHTVCCMLSAHTCSLNASRSGGSSCAPRPSANAPPATYRCRV